MIAGLSKAVILYLAPVLSLTAILLSLFAALAPSLLLHDSVALITITPSTSLNQSGPSKSVDGPSVFLGVSGSCSRTSNAGHINCTSATVSPVYDLSALPSNAPSFLISPPGMATPAFIAVALTFSIVFFFMSTLISFRHKMGKASKVFDRPMVQRLSAWIGFFGFMIGLTSFLILRMWFGKAVQDFNYVIMGLGAQGPQLIADYGNAFTMVWVAYAFFAVPLIVSLAKLNVQATK